MKQHFSFLAIALIVAALLLGTSAFQAQNGSEAALVKHCFPAASDLVSRDGIAEFLVKKPNVPIYKVPSGKWFVLTDLHVEHHSGNRA